MNRHGCGNDVLVVDGLLELDAARVRALCDRRTAWADGLLVIGAPVGRRWSTVIHNADGSIADACGNGSRCVARYLGSSATAATSSKLDTTSGVVPAWRDPEGFGIDLPAPELGEPLHVDGREARAVRVGNPNVATFVEDPAPEDLAALATASSALAGPANVGAVPTRGSGALALRVHERGVGETQACGTGSCAAVAAAIARGDVTSDTVRVRLRGGTLVGRPRGARYGLAGPAEYVFTGDV